MNTQAKRPASIEQDKPAMDEGSFQQLLAAAFVLQQHNDRAPSGTPEQGYARTLAGIIEAQEQVRSHRLDLQATASLVARRLRELSGASGSAVGILDGTLLEYYAASGSAAGEAGARLDANSTLAIQCLRTGQVLQCPRAETDSRLSANLCRQLGVKALLAVPVAYRGKVVGVLELHFSQADCFGEHDVRTCQLLSALLAETIASDEERPPQTVPTADPTLLPADGHASLLAALEKIKPQLDRLAAREERASSTAGSRPPRENAPSQSAAQPLAAAEPTCEACGHILSTGELFCPSCGMAVRSSNPWASLWEMQRASEAEKATARGASPQSAMAQDASSETLDVYPSEVEDILARLAQEDPDLPPARPWPSTQPQPSAPASAPASASAETSSIPLTWTFPPPEDAVTKHDELPSFGALDPRPALADEEIAYASDESLSPAGTIDLSASAERSSDRLTVPNESGRGLSDFWRKQHANIYVGAAALVLVAAIAGWMTPSQSPEPVAQGNSSVKAAAHHPAPPPPPELSFFDRVLVDLGLAEAPSAPTNPGNPKVRVWIDVHTALYYCAGSDLFGKTPGGRFVTQLDAQQDQFQPAARRPCN